ncbi:MAG: hypothetical protein Kow0068_02700 [Marinilabiliales bacterium]
MFLKTLLLTVILVALGFIGLAVTMLIKKGGKFPQTSIGKNKEMAKRGIYCVKHEELKKHRTKKASVVNCENCSELCN